MKDDELEDYVPPAVPPALVKRDLDHMLGVVAPEYRIKRDGEEWAAVYLHNLAQTMNPSLSAKRAGVTPKAVKILCDKDREFRAAIQICKSALVDALANEAYLRAFEGTAKPVFNKDGLLVNWKREVDNNLLLRVLAHLDPTWRPNQVAPSEGVTASDIADALANMRRSVPTEIVDAEFTEKPNAEDS